VSIIDLLRRRTTLLAAAAAFALCGCLPNETTDDQPPGPPPPLDEPPGDEPPADDPPPADGLAIVVGSQEVTVSEGGTLEVAVKLSSAPEGTVTVRAEFAGGSGVFTFQGPTSLDFDAGDYDTPKSLTIGSATDADTANDWARIRLTLGDGADVAFIDVAQEDTEGTPVVSEGVTLEVKDASGVGAVGHPVTAVIPLEYGKFQDTDGFSVEGPDGGATPAQFHVLNRWWARDGSIRHVVARFQATVPPDGVSLYTFQTSGSNPAPSTGVAVTGSGAKVTVDTGVLRFTVKRDGFNLFDEVWLDTNGDGAYAASEKIVDSRATNGPAFTDRDGNVQRPGDRGDLELVVEEAGPMHAVIRVAGLTLYDGLDDHTHGFAVRIYAYAGKSTVKVDYQLQNSAKNVRHAGPLFFDDVSLHVRPNLQSPTLRLATGPGNVWEGSVGSGRYLFQSSDSSASVHDRDGGTIATGSNERGSPSHGWADVSDGQRGMFVAVRHMAEMWPKVVEVSGDNDVAVRLWPKQSAMFLDGSLSSSGLYWLEDMQHYVKEVLFYFHGPGLRPEDLSEVARNFERHPIPFVPTSWYDKTRVTLDLDGIMPFRDPITEADDEKRYRYAGDGTDPSSIYYELNWVNFGGHTDRKISGAGGGWPTSAARIAATERVDYWMRSERQARDDYNNRPQSMAGYTYEEDFDRVQPVHWFYSPVWRAEDESLLTDTGQYHAHSYVPGTKWNGWNARDNQHNWSYHVEEFYYFSADPWIRDWYDWIGEFRYPERLIDGSPVHWHSRDDFSNNVRGEAHSFAQLLQAYRVTGKPKLLDRIKDRVRHGFLRNQKKRYGVPTEDGEAAFQVGFVARALIGVLTEVRGHDPQLYSEAFNVVWGIVDWNYNLSQYAYYIDSRTAVPGESDSSGTSVPLVGPVGWFAMTTGNQAMLDQARTYITDGLNGGSRAYGQVWKWENELYGRGGWVGRIGETVMSYDVDKVAPEAITNLTATANGGDVTIRWTTPARAERFHVVWADRPFTATYDRDDSVRNPWAGTPVGTDLEGRPGTQQSLTFGGVPSGQRIYVAVFTFGEDGAMSAMSNVAALDVP